MKYIKSDTVSYTIFKERFLLGYLDYNILYSPEDIPGKLLEENEIRAIACLFDYIQICPNARFDSFSGNIYFSVSKTVRVESIDALDKLLEGYRKKYGYDSEFCLYQAYRNKDNDNIYNVRFGIVRLSDVHNPPPFLFIV